MPGLNSPSTADLSKTDALPCARDFFIFACACLLLVGIAAKALAWLVFFVGCALALSNLYAVPETRRVARQAGTQAAQAAGYWLQQAGQFAQLGREKIASKGGVVQAVRQAIAQRRQEEHPRQTGPQQNRPQPPVAGTPARHTAAPAVAAAGATTTSRPAASWSMSVLCKLPAPRFIAVCLRFFSLTGTVARMAPENTENGPIILLFEHAADTQPSSVVRCLAWQANVSATVHTVRELCATMAAFGAKKAMLMIAGPCEEEVRQFAAKIGIPVFDGKALAAAFQALPSEKCTNLLAFALTPQAAAKA